jgi:hypothetical protein
MRGAGRGLRGAVFSLIFPTPSRTQRTQPARPAGHRRSRWCTTSPGCTSQNAAGPLPRPCAAAAFPGMLLVLILTGFPARQDGFYLPIGAGARDGPGAAGPPVRVVRAAQAGRQIHGAVLGPEDSAVDPLCRVVLLQLGPAAEPLGDLHGQPLWRRVPPWRAARAARRPLPRPAQTARVGVELAQARSGGHSRTCARARFLTPTPPLPPAAAQPTAP